MKDDLRLEVSLQSIKANDLAPLPAVDSIKIESPHPTSMIVTRISLTGYSFLPLGRAHSSPAQAFDPLETPQRQPRTAEKPIRRTPAFRVQRTEWVERARGR